MAWGMVLNVAAIYLAGRWILLLSRWSSLGVAALVAITVNPLFWSIENGFLPQTFGSAFALYCLCVSSRVLRSRSHSKAKVFFLALSATFSISTYAEIFSLILPAICVAWLVVTMASKRRRKMLFQTFGLAACLATLFANVDFVNTLMGMRHELSVKAGWHIPWSLMKFLGFAVGA